MHQITTFLHQKDLSSVLVPVRGQSCVCSARGCCACCGCQGGCVAAAPRRLVCSEPWCCPPTARSCLSPPSSGSTTIPRSASPSSSCSSSPPTPRPSGVGNSQGKLFEGSARLGSPRWQLSPSETRNVKADTGLIFCLSLPCASPVSPTWPPHPTPPYLSSNPKL